MRESIGSTWIFQLVIIFILIFVSFLILSLTYSKAYKNKNEILNIIEKSEGVTSNTVGIINNYLHQNGYSIKYRCPSNGEWLGATDLTDNSLERVLDNNKDYYYCVRRRSANRIDQSSSKKNLNDQKRSTKMSRVKKVYYEIKIFFRFNIPILETLNTFTIDGTTNDIFETNDLFDSIK